MTGLDPGELVAAETPADVVEQVIALHRRRLTGDHSRQASQPGTRQGQRYGVGRKFVHVCIDDASRIVFSQVLPDEKKESAAAFLHAAIAYYRRLGIAVSRVMTDARMGLRQSLSYRRASQAGARAMAPNSIPPITHLPQTMSNRLRLHT